MEEKWTTRPCNLKLPLNLIQGVNFPTLLKMIYFFVLGLTNSTILFCPHLTKKIFKFNRMSMYLLKQLNTVRKTNQFFTNQVWSATGHLQLRKKNI